MGLIVRDSLDLDNGMTLESQYVNIDDINVRKMTEGNFSVSARLYFYVSKEFRLNNKEYIKTEYCTLGVTSLNNLHGQIYTKSKEMFENVDDDL